jgi:hypothetical protein
VAIDIPLEYRARLRRLLPDLEEGISFEFTSPIDYNYNCLAWALSCNTRPFENARGAFWPWHNIPDDTAEGWAKVCSLLGFVPADDIEFENGYEKIAILEIAASDDPDEPRLHAARQDKNGRWKSKLGDMGPDIDHDGLAVLEQGYGSVVRVLKRRREDWD